MTEEIFDHPEMILDGTTAKGLPDDPGMEFGDPGFKTAADMIDTSDLGMSYSGVPTTRMDDSGAISPHSGGGPKVDPSTLPDNYLTHKAAQPVMSDDVAPLPPVAVPEVNYEELEPAEAIKAMAAELRVLRRSSASGGALQDCVQCAGSGKIPWRKRGGLAGYTHQGHDVMTKCPMCFPGQSGPPIPIPGTGPLRVR